MSQDIVEIANVTVAVLGATSCDFAVPTLANDLIGLAWEHEAEMVAVPVDCLPAEVFDLQAIFTKCPPGTYSSFVMTLACRLVR